jgi:hypothetical protein
VLRDFSRLVEATNVLDMSTLKIDQATVRHDSITTTLVTILIKWSMRVAWWF